MKMRFFKRITAFVVASLMALGVFTILPEECMLHSLTVSAQNGYSSFENVPCGANCQMSLSNGVLTISGSGPMFNYLYDGVGELYEGIGDYYDWTYYKDYMMACKEYINEIKIADTITYIGSYAFSGTNISTISLPSRLSAIGTNAFAECKKLYEITIPNNVETIGSHAFEYSYLSKIVIPKNTILNGYGIFEGCGDFSIYGYKGSSAEEYAIENDIPFVALDNNNPTYSEEDLLKFIKQKSGKDITNYIYIDMDYDGAKEIVAAILNDSFKYDIWYCSSDGSNCRFVKSMGRGNEYNNFRAIKYDEESHVIFNCGNNFGNAQDYAIFAPYLGGSGTISTVGLDSSGFASVTDKNTVLVTVHGYDPSDGHAVETQYELIYADYKYTILEKEFISATMTQFTNPINVGDNLLFNVVIRDSNGNPVNISDLTPEPTYTVSVSDTKCIRVDDKSTDLTGAFIKATAIGEGTATVTVTFSNGVSATSTVKVGKSEAGDDNTDTSSDSRYEKLHLIFEPKNISYTYNADTESFNVNSTDCEITLACLDLLQTGLFMDVNKIVVTPPKGFSVNGLEERTPHSFPYAIPAHINGGSDGDLSEHFVLYPPTKEFLEGNPLTDSYKAELTITVYGDDNFVKTFKQNINVKYSTSSEEPDEPIPDNAIVIDEKFSGDIIVNEGEYVVIRSQYGENYKAKINCDNLYVRGGTCKIVGTATLNVKGNAEVTGGKTSWLSNTEGGVLEVDGKLNINGNMLVGTDCGILNMTKSGSTVDVNGDFKITTNSTKYTCNLSNGTLKIGGNFESSGKYSGNFQASGNHLTVFYGDDFTIKMNKTSSYFNNIAFTSNAVKNNCRYGLDTLYSANVKGDFFEYGKPSVNLKYLIKDYNAVADELEKAYAEYYSNSSLLKNDLKQKLGKFISDDYINKIGADTEMFFQMEVMSGANDVQWFDDSGITLTMPKIDEELVFEDVPFGNSKADIYVHLYNSAGASINGSKSAICSVKWYAIGKHNYIEGSDTCILTYVGGESLYSVMMDLFKEQVHAQLNADDYWYWIKTGIKDILQFEGLLTGVDIKDANTVVAVIDKLYKTVTNRNLNAFKVNTAEKAGNLATQLEKIVDGKARWITAIFCPVDIEITDSLGNVVGSIVDNNVIVSTNKVTMTTVGDKKYCSFNKNDKYSIKLTATGTGTMDYIVDEISDKTAYRRVTFEKLPLTPDTVYTGSIECVEMQAEESYRLTDNYGSIYSATSDIVDLNGNIGSLLSNSESSSIPSTPSNSNDNTFSPANSTSSEAFNVKVENKITGKTNKSKATRTGKNVTVDVDKENNGYYANIYTTDGNLLDSVKIKSGKAKFIIQNDIDFYIIIDKDSHLEYEDVSSGAGIYEFLENKKEPLGIFVIIIAALGFLSIIIVKRFSKNKQ